MLTDHTSTAVETCLPIPSVAARFTGKMVAGAVRTAEADKEWQTLRARAALMRVPAFRTDPADGIPTFFSVAGGVIRWYADLPALRRRIEALEKAMRE